MTIDAQAAPTQPQQDGWLFLLRLGASAFYVWMNVWLGVFVLLGALFLSPTVLMTGSMEPRLSAGDVVLNSEPAPGQLYSSPTVITFLSDDRSITHRVSRVDEERGVMFTQGDANQAEDSSPVSPEQVEGVARLLVPYAGMPLVWITDGAWARLFVWLFSVALAAHLAFSDRARRDGSSADQKPAGGNVPHVAALIFAVAAATSATAISTTQASFVASTFNSGSSFIAADFGPPPPPPPPPASSSWYLRNTFEGGDTPRQPAMPISVASEPLPPGGLPNYSTDVDGAPGRELSTDGASSQAIWSSGPAATTVTFAGDSTLTIDVQRFEAGGGRATVTASLFSISPGGAETAMGSATAQTAANNPQGGGPNEPLEFTIPTAGTVDVDGRIELRLTVENRPVRLRYDTTTHPAELTLPNEFTANEPEVSFVVEVTDDWPTGFCAEVTVTGTVPYPVEWNIDVDLSTPPTEGVPYDVWNANWTYNATTQVLNASGVAFNRTVTDTQTATFGFCADKPSGPPTETVAVNGFWNFGGGSLSPTIEPSSADGTFALSDISAAGPQVNPFGVMNNDNGNLTPDVYGYPNAPQLRFGPPAGTQTPALAVANDTYVEFTVTAPADGSISFDELTFDAARGGNSSPRGLLLRSSADGFSTDLLNTDIVALRPTMEPVAADLSSLSDIVDGQELTFRLYIYSPNFNNTIEVNDLDLSIDVTTVAD